MVALKSSDKGFKKWGRDFRGDSGGLVRVVGEGVPQYLAFSMVITLLRLKSLFIVFLLISQQMNQHSN